MPSPLPPVHEKCLIENGYTDEPHNFFPENVALPTSSNEQDCNDLFPPVSLLVRVYSIHLTDTIPRIWLIIYNSSILMRFYLSFFQHRSARTPDWMHFKERI